MQASTPISKVMTRKPEVVSPSDTMEAVRKIFEKRGFHHVPVLQDKCLVGLVSYSDYLRLIRDIFDNTAEARTNEKVLNATLVKDVMSTVLICLKPEESAEEALQLLMQNEFHSLPVVDENNHLVGIVTTYDLMKVLEQVFASESVKIEPD
jgi:CBS domain-containing protein